MADFLSGSVRIAYRDEAPNAPAGLEPALLIHGFASNLAVNWRQPSWFGALLESGRRVIAIDNRGHGESEKLYDPADYHCRLMARDAVNLLAHLGVARADVIGYSMGARIAAYVALDAPRRVRRLILGGLGDRLVTGAGLPENLAEAMEAPSLDDLADPTQRLFRAFADRNGADRRALAACIRGARQAPAISEVARIVSPTLVVVGTHDTIAGDPFKLAAMLRNGRGLEVPGRDHNKTVGDRAFKEEGVKFLNEE